MPKRKDIKSILIIGAGPIVIGQACEFDYSGAQSCKALREEGYRVILVNSNPATIMTDPEMADATYIEPITPAAISKIIEKERPDAILPTMGGQTALNTAIELDDLGILKKFNVEMIAANKDVIKKAEDRLLFRKAMENIGLECPRSRVCSTLEEAKEEMEWIGLPAIIRPSFTLGGMGGGIAYNTEEYEDIINRGLAASPISEVLVEESVLGWKEFEMEVVRDKADNCIIICSIENIDPMGVHTGDSVTVAPALTLTDKEYQYMRNASIACLREIGVETGGSNVQFAINPDDGRLVVIEMNPRVSRSSALASKATGFPIAKIAAKLAVGYTLDELDNDITGVTPASFEPTIDYVVTKIPRFTFEKFPLANSTLTTSMKSVGEAMAIGRSFAESMQKGLRSLETGLSGFDEVEIPNIDRDGAKDALRSALALPKPDRILTIAQGFRLGVDIKDIQKACMYDMWFLEQIKEIIDEEENIRANGLPENASEMIRIKAMGFSDERLAKLTDMEPEEVAEHRHELQIKPVYKRIDTCAAEFGSKTSYMYSCYEGDGMIPPDCEAQISDNKKIIILGGGPNRIGQGIEFDYCCVHAAYALKEMGIEAIMVNCNPETVSTDYDTSDRLYFEPLTAEDVLEIAKLEQSKGELLGVIVQLGGQTPLKLSYELENAGIPILGTSPDAIDLAEDRERFQELLHKLELKQPENGIAHNVEEAIDITTNIGYPVVIRPSYVLGGRAMQIVHDEEKLLDYMHSAVIVSGKNPVLIDSYLQNAIEVDVDVICDGKSVYVAGVMQHVEEAGIHSGDSSCTLPPYSLSDDMIDELKRQSELLALELGVKGLMNVQYAIKGEDVYILEVNPRGSRTIPFVAKATGVQVAKIATKVMAGTPISQFELKEPKFDHIAVKEAVFPFARFPGVDVILGPEMKSTGEVMGIDNDMGMAFAKAEYGNKSLPSSGTVLVSVKDEDKDKLLESCKKFVYAGFKLMGTNGTAKFLQEHGFEVERVNKVIEGRPHIVDAIKSGKAALIVNTVQGSRSYTDSYAIRESAVRHEIPYTTTVEGAYAIACALEAVKDKPLTVKSLQEYFG
ncbi:MAG: carbamoyl-phosphate synthase large subunit [Alphaproteobacteria bacterium]|nr:carbamoyl-phosphate synthase large subunit [Alphaproteobacteria bacterium]